MKLLLADDDSLNPKCLGSEPSSNGISDEIRLTEELNADLYRSKLAEAQMHLQSTALMAAGNGIVITDRHGDIVWVNPAFSKLTGYSSQEVIGRNPRLLNSGKHNQRFYEDNWKTILSGHVWSGEMVNRRKDGTLYTEEQSITPVKDDEGKVSHFIAIKQDISERKQMEQVLRDRDVAEAANRLKSEFLANMSHELRTPLNAIIGFSELMHDGKVGPVSAEHKEYLGDILTSSRHLLQLINDILDLSKVEAGRMEFTPEPVELESIIGETRAVLQALSASKRLAVEVEVSPAVERLIIDPAKLKQVLYNYLSNAIKFTPEAGRITVRALAEEDDSFRLEVEDTGIGIREEEIGKLFVEFQQLEAGTTKKHQGTGLGLALTKKIVEAQGGRVGVKSTPDEGSVFYAVLPRVASINSEVLKRSGLEAL